MNPRAAIASWTELAQQAKAITIKVFSGDTTGSGILVQCRGQIYTVLTNQHVLRQGDAYRVQTPDGRIYAAVRDISAQFAPNDLAMLTFRSRDSSYAIATLGSAFALPVGEPVFAAGFPAEDGAVDPRGFKFTSGQVALISKKMLEGGYQLGYTNDIRKGMSGGPVLNRQAEVVGVNGMHQEPLWGDPYVFQDGSRPCLPLRNLMVHSSWAIPIETFVQLVPHFQFPATSLTQIRNSSTHPPVAPLLAFAPSTTLLLQKRADAGVHCRVGSPP